MNMNINNCCPACCCVNCCCPKPKPPKPKPPKPKPCPECPTGSGDILVAAGTGAYYYGKGVFLVRFGPPLLKTGDAIREQSNGTHFIIKESGTYEISWQISLDTGLSPHNLHVNLETQRVLDTIYVNERRHLYQSRVVVDLAAGESVYAAVVDHNALDKIHVIDQAIAIRKLT